MLFDQASGLCLIVSYWTASLIGADCRYNVKNIQGRSQTVQRLRLGVLVRCHAGVRRDKSSFKLEKQYGSAQQDQSMNQERPNPVLKSLMRCSTLGAIVATGLQRVSGRLLCEEWLPFRFHHGKKLMVKLSIN